MPVFIHVQHLFQRLGCGCIGLKRAISLAALLEDLIDIHGLPSTNRAGWVVLAIGHEAINRLWGDLVDGSGIAHRHALCDKLQSLRSARWLFGGCCFFHTNFMQ